ncbi:sensor domain-containing diguanylate cyclase [Thalassospira mesophila]|uniref:sensor domain-containing diguanylate cyclase n=1 Tax=Thalassospira mesophila TaxID=1293891 RepID=UPI000A1E65D7|nr:GGDEF domain-containing protein [Thalassospira mesophila]
MHSTPPTRENDELAKLKLGSSLFARQLKWGLLIALLSGLLIMLYQGVSDYRSLLTIYNQTNQRVINSALLVANSAVLNRDVELANAVVGSALVQRSVASARLIDANGDVLVEQRRNLDELPQSIWVDRLFGGISTQEVALHVPGGNLADQRVIGELQITFSPHVYIAALYRRMEISFFGVLVFALVITCGLVGVTYLIVTKPILELSAYMVTVNPVDVDKHLPMPPPYRHDDEIQLLGSSMIGLFGLIRNKVQKLGRATDALQAANQTLEMRVEQRTHELNEVVEKLELLAATDPLTGLANRRALMGRLKNAIAVWKRRGTRVGVIILDLDHFKTLNDTYGHQAGDTVLKSLASVCHKVLRETDLPGRMGGEEFAVLVNDEDEKGMMVVAERLRKAIEADTISANGQTIHYSASLGVACLPAVGDMALSDGEGMEALLRQAREVEAIIDMLYSVADRALYSAKENGRNQCVFGALPASFSKAGE